MVRFIVQALAITLSVYVITWALRRFTFGQTIVNTVFTS